MSHLKNIIAGVFIILLVISISIVTYIFSSGSCENGTFLCDDDDGDGDGSGEFKCLPHHLVCGRTYACREKYKVVCGLFYGHVDYIKNITSVSDVKLTSVVLNTTDSSSCDIWKPPAESCFCFESNLLCGDADLTEIPRAPLGFSLLYLEGNKIKLTENSLNGLNLTHKLDLSNNNLSELPSRVFHSQKHLQQLFLRRNHIENIPPGLFKEMHSLKWLMLQENEFYSISLKELRFLTSLEWLDLSKNHLNFEGERFPEQLANLQEMDLSFNKIETIPGTLFPKMMKLGFLSLDSNKISSIDWDAFNGLPHLKELRISNNLLASLDPRTLYTLNVLDALFVGNNFLRIDSKFFKYNNLSYLNLNGTELDYIDFESINNAKSIKAVYFNRFYYCSKVPRIQNCMPRTDGLSTTKDLLSKSVLRYSAWMMAFITCLGNSLVLWGRYTQRDENRALSIVIRNLAVSDMLMGFYLSFIAIQDHRFREQYHFKSMEWVTSWSCIVIGMLAVTSSEVSLLILTFISVERFLLIAGPFSSRRRLNTNNIRLCLFAIWLSGGSIALFPVILYRKSTYFYGSYAGTCIPLHLQEPFPIGWEYSAAIFMGVNFSLLLVIAYLYFALFISIWRTQKLTPLGVFDYEFAVRFFFIVLVDALCWVPIIAMKASVFLNYEISADLYAFLVVFVLPLNSAVNPILYTFTTTKYRNQFISKSWYRLTGSKSTQDGSGRTVSCSNQCR